jgi:parallel beta-helix repeat protein
MEKFNSIITKICDKIQITYFSWSYILILLTSTFLFISPVFSKTYFVSSSGNNYFNGTKNYPFKTISYAQSRISGGDTIYIRNGTYNETVAVYGISEGTESDPTVLSAYNGERVIIDGSGINVGAGNGLVRSFVPFTQFIGLEVKNSDQSGITLDNNKATNSKIIECIIHDCKEGGIGLYADNSTVERCTIYNVCLNNLNGVLSIAWSAGIGCRGTANSVSSNCIIKNNTIHDVWGEGIGLAFTNKCIVENNIIYDFFSVGLYSRNSQNIVNQRNLIYNTKVLKNGSQVGIGHWNEGNFTYVNKNNSYVNNIVYHCRRNFYHGALLEGLLVANNTFINSTYSTCVEFDAPTFVSGEFRNNIVVQEDALPCIVIDKNVKIIYSNNLYNKTYNSIAIGEGDVVGDPKLKRTGDTSAGNLTAEYFKLTSTSPAINKGVAITKVTDDIFGNDRDSSPDIGAHEYYAVEPFNKVTSISVRSATGSTTIFNGLTLQLIAELLPANATNKQVIWSVRNGTGQADINSSGMITGINPGYVQGIATAQDGSGVFGTIEIKIANRVQSEYDMIIYPNPARYHFNIFIRYSMPVPTILKIFTLTGIVVLEKIINAELNEINIPISLSAGIYFVQLSSNSHIYDCQKLIVER